MPRITFEGQRFDCNSDETILECMARHDVVIPSSCRNGVCQTCMMRAVEGTPPASSQKDLKPTLQQQGYFLACGCKPESDLTIVIAGDEAHEKISVTVIDKTALNNHILRLRLESPGEFIFNPGQFLNLTRTDGLVRSYSIASLPSENFIELHIERLPGGKMSNWLHDELKINDSIEIDGPHGDCYYLEGKPDQNLLLIGTGSGLAPLWGICRDALSKRHQGEIHLFHGSHNTEKLYLIDELKALAAKNSNFNYIPCVSGEEPLEGFAHGRANEIALTKFAKLDNWRVYLCGHPEMVNGTKMKAFLAGAALQEIHADPFTIAS